MLSCKSHTTSARLGSATREKLSMHTRLSRRGKFPLVRTAGHVFTCSAYHTFAACLMRHNHQERCERGSSSPLHAAAKCIKQAAVRPRSHAAFAASKPALQTALTPGVRASCSPRANAAATPRHTRGCATTFAQLNNSGAHG